MSDNTPADPPDSGDIIDPVTLRKLQRAWRRIAVALSIVLILGGVALLAWNEVHTVRVLRSLDRGRHQIIEISSDKVDPTAHGRLVHLTAMATVSTPATDPVLGITDVGVLRLKRTVEMYQWVELPRSDGGDDPQSNRPGASAHRYVKRWEQTGVDSSRFADPEGHGNPPMPVTSATIDSPDVRLGVYRVDPSLLQTLTAFAPLMPPPEAVPAGGFRVDGDMLYRGHDSDAPVIGDVRVLYTAVTAQLMSAIAVVSDDALTVATGRHIARLEPGAASAPEMLQQRVPLSPGLIWAFRATGFLALLAGLVLIAGRLAAAGAGPASARRLAEAAGRLLPLVVAAVSTLAVLGLAWLLYRPLVGLLLLALAAGLPYVVLRLGGGLGAAGQ